MLSKQVQPAESPFRPLSSLVASRRPELRSMRHIPSLTQMLRVVCDVVIINAAVAMAFVARYLWSIISDAGALRELGPSELFARYVDSYLQVGGIVTVICIICFALSDVYASGGVRPRRLKAVIIAEALTLAFVITGGVLYLIDGDPPVSWKGLALAWALALALFWSSRLWSAAWRYVLRTEAGVQSDRVEGGERVEEPVRAQQAREKTVLVIGGAGYIGSALLPKLLAQGRRVRVMDLLLYGTGPIKDVLDHPRLEIIRADFRQIDRLVKAMQGVEQVVHLGGIVGDPACAFDEELTIDINLAATRSIAEVAKGNGIRHFIFASTCSVYGAGEDMLRETSPLNPLSLYARTKMASEKVLLEMADDTFTPLIVRFGTIFGLSGRTRFDLVVNLLAAKAAFEGRVAVFGGEQWRPFVHVDDAAHALVQLLRLPAGRGAEVFNVGSNQQNYTIDQVAEIVQNVLPETEIVRMNEASDRRNYRVDFCKIKMAVGFNPRWTVEDGVRQVIDAIQAGQISDYREMQYSNELYLSETKAVGLAPPRFEWAHQLVNGSSTAVR